MKLSPFVRALAFSAFAVIPCIALTPQEFQIRLLTPLASFSQPGTRFEAKVIGATKSDDRSLLPPETRIFGSVAKAKATGLGIRRERAILELEFDPTCVLPTGESVACDISLRSVDNARESVKDGRIVGVLAASHPNSWLSGVWYRPDVDLVHRSAMGLTGVGGLLYSSMASPAGAALMIGSHLLLFRIPDPEISLPTGTDLIVRVEAGVSGSQVLPTFSSASDVSPEVLDRLASIPPQVTKRGDKAAIDLLNIALIGSREQIVRAFNESGWSGTEVRTAKTVARTYSAYANMKTYPSAPVSSMYFEGRLPDLVFQKSFNTLAKRHHVRLWQVEVPGGTAWVGAATHDTAIEFHARHMALAHSVDPLIDREKNVLMNDLNAAGCVSSSSSVDRPEVAREGSDDVGARTDGTMMVATLRECTSPENDTVALSTPKHSVGALFVRQVVLDTRQYVERGNAYYWAVNGIRRLRMPRRDGDVTNDSAVEMAAVSAPADSSAAFVASASKANRRSLNRELRAARAASLKPRRERNGVKKSIATAPVRRDTSLPESFGLN